MEFYIGRTKLRRLTLKLRHWKKDDDAVIEAALGKISGVTCGGLNTTTGEIQIPYDPGSVTPDKLEKIIQTLGFDWTDRYEEPDKGFQASADTPGCLAIILLIALIIWLVTVY